MTYFIKPLVFKPPRLIGLSEQMLASHYELEYGGAVRQLNAVNKQLAALHWQNTPGPAISSLQKARLAAANSAILHEIYFDSLGGQDGLGSPAMDPGGELAEAVIRDFGSIAAWREQFSAMAKALTEDSGWVVLQWCVRSQRLHNQSAAGYGAAVAGSTPLIALDMFEHAYKLDFGADASTYVDVFMENLHWGRAAKRFAMASGALESIELASVAEISIAPETLRRQIIAGEPLLLMDVCLLDDLPKRHDKLPGALCLQNNEVAQAMANLPKNKPIVAYCMYGFQVSTNAVDELRAAGFDARLLAGGISAWRAIGASTEPYAV